MSDTELNIGSQASLSKKITAQEFAAKLPTKRDVWRFLGNEAKWYLPPEETVTIWHLRDMAMGKRTHIKNSKLRNIHMPHYTGLRFDDLEAEAKKHPAVMKALPEKLKEWEKLPRAYMGNVMATIIGDKFEDWVKDKVEERNAKIKKEREMELELDDDIANIFLASTAVGGKYSFDGGSIP